MLNATQPIFVRNYKDGGRSTRGKLKRRQIYSTAETVSNDKQNQDKDKPSSPTSQEKTEQPDAM